ncbi:MAG: hypothetical protein U0271_00865 [Polyangiaceae bacterium]
MKKVILEILALLWKAVRSILWKWLRPRLRKFAAIAVAFLALLGILTVLIAGSCNG